MKADIYSQEKGKKIKISLHNFIYSQDAKSAGEFCQKLKTRDTDILDSYDDNGMTPLHIAIQHQDLELVELLLEYGADPNKRDLVGNTPIMRAVERNNPQIVGLLLEEGADFKKTDDSNQAILKIANDNNADKCIDILREYGAFFVMSKKRNAHESIYSGVDSFIEELSKLVLNIVSNSNKTVSFSLFYDIIQERTKLLLGVDNVNINSAKANINKVFDQILSLSANKNFDKIDSLKAIRHLVNVLSKVPNISDDSLLVFSKLENVIEEEIVHSRALQLTVNNKTLPESAVAVTRESTQVLGKDASVTSKNSDLINIETIKIISKNISHDVDLINFVKIVPHHIQSKDDVKYLTNLSNYRLKFQDEIFNSQSSDPKNSAMEIAKILKNADHELLMNNAVALDKILRIGKEEQIHILDLSLDHFKDIENELKNEAIELGANVYCIEYPKKPKHKFDLIYAGIAAVNKLLDDNIHPDKIFIQCDGNSYDITKVVVSQFAKRGVALSEIIIADSHFDYSIIENNHRCLLVHPQASKIKQSTKYDGAFKEFFKHLSKVFKNPMIQSLQFSTELLKNYTVMQLITLFIKCNQVFLKENIQSRNPSLPNDKVDNIIGIIPDEV